MSTDNRPTENANSAGTPQKNPEAKVKTSEVIEAKTDVAPTQTPTSDAEVSGSNNTAISESSTTDSTSTVGSTHKATKVVERISESIDDQNDYPGYPRWLRLTMRWSVCILSILLIIYISIETFRKVPFMDNMRYMYFQLFVCIVFMADFFIELHYSYDRRRYWKYHWLFLVLSFPWLNVVDLTSITLSTTAYYYARFIPLARGALALALVSSYITKNRIGGLLMAYLTIMIMVVYFGSLVFYTVEAPVNPGVTSYWIALWWAMLESTTYGASIYPVTAVGKLFNFIISAMGIIMFPLLTVYLTSWVKKQVNKTSDEL